MKNFQLHKAGTLRVFCLLLSLLNQTSYACISTGDSCANMPSCLEQCCSMAGSCGVGPGAREEGEEGVCTCISNAD